jgi:hypothetical protein
MKQEVIPDKMTIVTNPRNQADLKLLPTVANFQNLSGFQSDEVVSVTGWFFGGFFMVFL